MEQRGHASRTSPSPVRSFQHAAQQRVGGTRPSGVQLSRWVAAGELQRLGRGLYALPDYAPNQHASLVEVASRAPQVVFCLLTALRFHGLTTQAPFEVWIAIGNKEHPPRLPYPKLRVQRFCPASLHYGVEEHRVGGATLRVTDVAKTVADCFKSSTRSGWTSRRRRCATRRKTDAPASTRSGAPPRFAGWP
jgi:predicted transcriptional regulator of viral defense system